MWVLELPEARAMQLVQLLKERGIKGSYKKLADNKRQVCVNATKEQRGEAREIIKYIKELEKK